MRVREIAFYRLPLVTRFPFRYGIASMTAAPHLFVRAVCEFDNVVAEGLSADLLPPKWFTKNSETTFEDDDLPAMLQVIAQAARLGPEIVATSFFDWWRELYLTQQAWAQQQQLAPLLAGFGVSLIERAVLDAFCRSRQSSLGSVLRHNLVEAKLDSFRAELGTLRPADVIAAKPPSHLRLRHTVGLGDPLEDSDISADDRLDDGLPHSLVANIRQYGLSYFKIKLQGDLDADRQRLEQLASLFEQHVDGDYYVTVDGNENYRNVESFREHWRSHQAQPRLQRLLGSALLMVEQPIHRDVALADDVREALAAWPDAPPIIIDESDGELDSAPRALQLGYAGVSHKNCKGVMKGLLNAAEITRLRSAGRSVLLSAEDLANYGPVALTQDLAVAAILGVEHIERNGHHYFAGLSGMQPDDQQRVLTEHGDLFHQHAGGFAALRVESGRLSTQSVLAAPFGYKQPPDLTNYDRLQLVGG